VQQRSLIVQNLISVSSNNPRVSFAIYRLKKKSAKLACDWRTMPNTN